MVPFLTPSSLRNTEALEAATASLSVDAQKRAAKDAQKKAAKAEAAEQRHADKLAHSVITIRRIERNKRKFVTAVSGLEAFGLELKKVGFLFFLSFFFSVVVFVFASLPPMRNATANRRRVPPRITRYPRISVRSLLRARLSPRSPAAGRRLSCKVT